MYKKDMHINNALFVFSILNNVCIVILICFDTTGSHIWYTDVIIEHSNIDGILICIQGCQMTQIYLPFVHEQ